MVQKETFVILALAVMLAMIVFTVVLIVKINKWSKSGELDEVFLKRRESAPTES